MNRNTIVAIVAAAVLGTTGGVALAAQNSGTSKDPGPAAAGAPTSTPSTSTSDPTSTPSGTVSKTADPQPTNADSGPDSSTNEPLLYATSTVIHDGKRSIPINNIPHPGAIVRMQGGWVLANKTSTQAQDYDLWFVATDGQASKLGATTGDWDANPEGTQVVALTQSMKVTMWTVASGAKTVWPEKIMGATYPAFMGDKVLISSQDEAGVKLFEWDPAKGTTTDDVGQKPNPNTSSVGYTNMALSPGGSYLTGNVDAEGSPSFDGECLHLENTPLRKTPASWNTCDWRANGNTPQFSPDGTRLLVIPRASDGYGPGLFGVIDASDGPSTMVARIPMPDWTQGAEWADNNHLYVYGGFGDDLGNKMFIAKCDFQGACTRMVTSPTRLVVGRTR